MRRPILLPLLLLGLGSLACAADFPHDGVFDLDGDGFGDASDCDDADAGVHPGAGERCDGAKVDEDCDGRRDDDDDDVVDPPTWFGDQDEDGYGDEANTEASCEPEAGFVAEGTDCDDEAPSVNPGAPEVCDDARVDEDCDGESDDDDDDVTGRTTYFADTDGDGYGNAAAPEPWCDPPNDVVDDDTDCDDDDDDIHPRASETCNGVDDDCDGKADDADPEGPSNPDAWYSDEDGDGYGDPFTRYDACVATGDDVGEAGDCDDDDASVNAGATEVCGDGVDQDCDSSGNACFIDGTVDDDDADAVVKANATNTILGWHAARGDTDGDGVAEVWLSGTFAEGAGAGYGGAVAITGRLSGKATADELGLAQIGAFDAVELGYGIASGGDLDGDGDDEVVLSTPFADSPATDAGAAYVFAGPVAAGTTELDALFAWTGINATDNAGTAVAIGDFDGDGEADLFMSLPDSYEVVGLLGPLTPGSATSATWDVRADGQYYETLALGDLTGDGISELVVGDYGYSRVYVYEGGASGAIDASDRLTTFDSTYSTIGLGTSLLADADYDGDGHNDLIVGAPWTDDYMGMIYEIDGPLTASTYDDTDVDLEVRGVLEGAYFGYSLAHGGDMSDDGRGELVVGAPGDDSGGITDGGAVYLFDESPTSGERTTADAGTVVIGTNSSGELGLSVAAADVDGDGATDLLCNGDYVATPIGTGGSSIFYGGRR